MSAAEQPANRRKRPKAWSESVGEYGHRIRLYEDPKSGILYGEMRDLARPGRYRAVSLRHRDKERARKWAHEQVAAWIAGESLDHQQLPTLSRVLALYLQHQSPRKTKSEQDADRRRAELWTRFLGGSSDLSKLSLRSWQGFIDERRSGAINSRGERVAKDKQQPVRTATLAGDLVFMRTLLNWATRWRLDNGRYLMSENPARGYTIPTEKNPRRPVVTQDRFERVRAKAPEVRMVVFRGRKRLLVPTYLPELLDIANGTGRRISAILALRYCDLLLAEGTHGCIRWPAETDKLRKEWTVPISVDVRTAIDRVLDERPGIGAAYLFPAVKDRSTPIAVEVASEWLRKAERLAGVPKQEGSLWHAYRRKWATERKFMPLPDVAAAGGWSDQNTLLQVYQQADFETMYRVVSEPATLRETFASSTK